MSRVMRNGGAALLLAIVRTTSLAAQNVPDSTVVELPELVITSGRSAPGYVERHSERPKT